MYKCDNCGANLDAGEKCDCMFTAPDEVKQGIEKALNAIGGWKLIDFQQANKEQVVVLAERISDHLYCSWLYGVERKDLYWGRYGSIEAVKPVYEDRLGQLAS